MKRSRATFASHVVLACTWPFVIASCATPEPTVARVPDEPQIVLNAVGADIVLPGTRITLVGENFPRTTRATLRARFSDGAGVDLELDVDFVSSAMARIVIDESAHTALGGDGARFDGEISLRAEFESGARAQEVSIAARFDLATSLTPRLDALDGSLVYLGSRVRLSGDGFLAPEEGGTRIHLVGTFAPDDTTAPVQAVDRTVLARFESRSSTALEVGPELFGIRPGQWTGTLTIFNTPLASAPTSPLSPRAFALTLGPTALLELGAAARRGQRLVARGRGFLPREGRSGQATLLRFDGTFRERIGGAVHSWEGADALQLVPDFDHAGQLSYVLRVYQTPSGDLAGLGLVAGTFEGRVTPVLVRGDTTLDGLPLTARVEILPARQVIFLRYLPGFTDTLRTLGLRNVELPIRARIREVCERDFARWNVEFRETRPADYVEYGVVEIGGPDPNEQGLFGLDNTTGKDLGNLRLNDVIGGYNAETEEQGFLAYGGVFLESFLALSPKSREPLPIASPTFDLLFDRFRLDRGGSAVAPGEFDVSPRADAIAEGVRVLGNLIGTTITHEIGHTLGMAVADGFFHNPLPGPNQLMDSGDERPFEERAELGGQGPAEFEPEHVEYLDQILPKE